jgi:hydroxypyruvate isomerase
MRSRGEPCDSPWIPTNNPYRSRIPAHTCTETGFPAHRSSAREYRPGTKLLYDRHSMTRRSLFTTTAAALAATQIQAAPSGRLKQGVARWCFNKMSLEDLCRESARIGLTGIDLVSYKEWPVVQKFGLTPSMVPGAASISDGWNRKENHEKLENDMRQNIERAAEAKIPNVITFSGNRRGLSDAEGLENCVIGLNRVKRIAEDKGVTICMELLNSKVDHKDYQCDHTAWGVEMCKRVDSPRVKLLYDIYHMQIMEGDIIRNIRDNIAYLGHFHTGGNPGRHEIDETQELYYPAIARAIADLNFTGWVSHEFVPAKDPIPSLEAAAKIFNV